MVGELEPTVRCGEVVWGLLRPAFKVSASEKGRQIGQELKITSMSINLLHPTRVALCTTGHT